jgi:hypothetical protein
MKPDPRNLLSVPDASLDPYAQADRLIGMASRNGHLVLDIFDVDRPVTKVKYT